MLNDVRARDIHAAMLAFLFILGTKSVIRYSNSRRSPQVNFVGKLLGPQGSTIKRLQEETGAKISVLGKGSMRDKNKVCDGLTHGASLKNRSPDFMFLPTAAFHILHILQEEELRKGGEAKYAHLAMELHVFIEVTAPIPEAYLRMAHAMDEVKKFLIPVWFRSTLCTF